jgi:histidyl-tRNA synthetase
MGLKGVELRLSHAGLIKVLLEKLGLSPEERNRMFDRILDGDAGALGEISRESPELAGTLGPLLNLKGQSSGFLRNQKALLARTMPESRPYLDEFLETVDLLDELGVKYQINIASGAGFEYYTGIIFQFFIGKEKVGGGGRYDALIPSMGGGDVPASGFALYLDSLVKLVKPQAAGGTAACRVQVRAESADVVKDAFRVAGELRESGYVVELELDGKKSSARWLVEVRRGTPQFALIDNNTRKKKDTSTISEVMKLLEADGGD